MIGTGAAIIGSTIAGSLLSNRANNKAIDAQRDAANSANALTQQQIDLQSRMYDEGMKRSEPYYQAGTNALTKYMSRLNDGFNAGDLANDPGYQFQLAEGVKALDRSAAGRGSLYSGAQMKALSRFNQGLASTNFGNAYNRWVTGNNQFANAAGLGQTANAQQNSLAGQYGANSANLSNQMGQNMIGVGNAQAAAGMSNANNWQNLINGGVSNWLRFNQGGGSGMMDNAFSRYTSGNFGSGD